MADNRLEVFKKARGQAVEARFALIEKLAGDVEEKHEKPCTYNPSSILSMRRLKMRKPGDSAFDDLDDE